MIAFVQGPPGSGKTLYAVDEIYQALCAGKHVYTNVEFVSSWPVIMAGRWWRKWIFSEKKILDDAASLLARYHVINDPSQLPYTSAKESSRLVVIDEAQLMFNCRERDKRGSEWLKWFSQSRKCGCDVLMVAQDHQMVDRQLRLLAEQLITCWSLVRWRLPLLVYSIPIGQMITDILGPVFYRRATFVGMAGLTLWRNFGCVPGFIARIYYTTQLYGIDACSDDVPNVTHIERKIPVQEMTWEDVIAA